MIKLMIDETAPVTPPFCAEVQRRSTRTLRLVKHRFTIKVVSTSAMVTSCSLECKQRHCASCR